MFLFNLTAYEQQTHKFLSGQDKKYVIILQLLQ